MSQRQPIMRTSRGASSGAYGTWDWVTAMVCSLAFGSAFLFIAVSLEGFPAPVVSLLRAGIAGAALAVFRPWRIRIAPEDRGSLWMVAILWVTIPVILMPLAQQWISSGVAGMIAGTSPITTAVLTAWLLRSWPGRLQTIGVGLGLVGVVLISIPQFMLGSSAGLGVVLMMLAVVPTAVSITIAMPLLRRYGAVPVMGKILPMGALLLVPYAVPFVGRIEWGWTPVAAALALGVWASAVPYATLGYLAGQVGSTRASFVGYLVPVVALILGVVVLGEEVAAMALAGIVLVLVGAFLTSRKEA